MSASFPATIVGLASPSIASTSDGQQPVPSPGQNSEDRRSKRPAPRGTAAYPRKRANMACQVCRARRTKCDNKRPSCSFCEKAGTTCTWAPHDLSSFDPASLAILERFDQLESLILSSSSQIQAQTPLQTVQSPLSERRNRRESIRGQSLGCVSITSINIRLEAVLEWQPLQNSLGRTTFSHHGETLSVPVFEGLVTNLDELDMITCNRLLDSFWRRVHSKNPILVQDDIRKYMRQICLDGISWDAKSCLVLLICALGTLATDFQTSRVDNEEIGAHEASQVKAQAQHYFAASQKRITVCLGKRGIIEAQCFFYCGVYLATMMQPEAAWSMFLQAKASCQSFEWLTQVVPRDENFESKMRPDEVWVAEECTYWTCLKSEIELHLELNPPGFRIIDLWYPNKFPDPPRHTITDSDRSWFFYLAEIALRRLANRILDFVATGHNLDNPEDIIMAHETAAEFEREAHDWVQSLPSPNELDRYGDNVLDFILKGHLANCYEFIYWPFIRHAINSPWRNPANDEYVRKGLQVAVDRLEVNKPGFKHRHHGTHGMIRSCARSALVLLAAHFNGNLEDSMPVGWFEILWSVVDLLKFWQDELPRARGWRDRMIHLMDEAQRPTL